MGKEQCPIYPHACDIQTLDGCFLYKQYVVQSKYTIGTPPKEFSSQQEKTEILEKLKQYAHENHCPQADIFPNPTTATDIPPQSPVSQVP
jgi:hypothetical protein